MKLLSLCLLATVLSAAEAPPRGAALPPILLFTQTQEAIPAAVQDAMRDEVDSIMAPAGFHFEWHDLAEASQAGIAVELAVLTFRGSCDTPVTLLRKPTETQRALGFTASSDGEILPFTTVDCDRTRTFLAAAVLRLPADERQPAFGRALGRILAHELFHIFASTPRHASSGIAKESYTVQDLLTDDFSFEEREYEMLRNGKAHTALSLADAVRDQP